MGLTEALACNHHLADTLGGTHLHPGGLLQPGLPDGLTYGTIVTQLFKARLLCKKVIRDRRRWSLLPCSRQSCLQTA